MRNVFVCKLYSQQVIGLDKHTIRKLCICFVSTVHKCWTASCLDCSKFVLLSLWGQPEEKFQPLKSQCDVCAYCTCLLAHQFTLQVPIDVFLKFEKNNKYILYAPSLVPCLEPILATSAERRGTPWIWWRLYVFISNSN